MTKFGVKCGLRIMFTFYYTKSTLKLNKSIMCFSPAGGVDIRVEIKDPDDKIQKPLVEDFTAKQGCYKVYYMSPKLGRHTATILINGESINQDGYKFNVTNQDAGRQSVTYSKIIY